MNKKVMISFIFITIFFINLYAKLMEEIVIKVNDEIILKSEIEETINLLKTQLKMAGKKVNLKKLKQEVIENLINQRLIITMAKDENINVSDDAVNDKTNEFIDALRSKFPSEKDFEDRLLEDGLTYTDFRLKIESQVRDNLIFSKVKQKKQQEFISKTSISDDEIKKYYKKHKDDFKVGDEVKIYQIFFPYDKSIKNLKEIAYDTYDRLKNGEKIDAVKNYLKNYDGVEVVDIGWVDTTQLDKKIRKALKHPYKGMITKPIKKDDGYHIIKVFDYKKGKVAKFENVKDKIKIKLIEQKVNKMWEEWLKQIKKNAYIEYVDKEALK